MQPSPWPVDQRQHILSSSVEVVHTQTGTITFSIPVPIPFKRRAGSL